VSTSGGSTNVFLTKTRRCVFCFPASNVAPEVFFAILFLTLEKKYEPIYLVLQPTMNTTTTTTTTTEIKIILFAKEISVHGSRVLFIN
jgi:hypothetical protein